MKLKTVICEDEEEEIIIKAKSRDDKIIFLEDIIKNAIGENDTILLHNNQTQYFIPIKKILFLESLDGKVAVHTAENIFYSNYKLYELLKILPSYFERASKSTIINTKAVYSVKKNIYSSSEISFNSCAKKAYLSRNYYKIFMDKINETRIKT